MTETVEHPWGTCETFANIGFYQLRMLNVERGWRINLTNHVGGSKNMVVAKGAVSALLPDGSRQFMGNGGILVVDHRIPCSVVALERSQLLEITHGYTSDEVKAEYTGWHISYDHPNMLGGIYLPPNKGA